MSFELQCLHLNGISLCTVRCTPRAARSRTILFFMRGHLHHEVGHHERVVARLIQRAQNSGGWLNKTRSLSGTVRGALASAHSRPRCRNMHFFSKPTYSDWSHSLLTRIASRAFSSSGPSTNNLRNGTPLKCARLTSYIARVRLPFASS